MNMNCSNKMTLGVLLLSLLTLYGCEDLVIRDTSSLFIPRFRTVRDPWLCGGIWNDLCRRARLSRNAQAAVKRGDEPEDGGHHRCLSNSLGLLRLVGSPAGGVMPVWNLMGIVINFVSVGACSIFPQSQAVRSEVIAPTGRAMEVILRSRRTSRTWQGRRTLILN